MAGYIKCLGYFPKNLTETNHLSCESGFRNKNINAILFIGTKMENSQSSVKAKLAYISLVEFYAVLKIIVCYSVIKNIIQGICSAEEKTKLQNSVL